MRDEHAGWVQWAIGAMGVVLAWLLNEWRKLTRDAREQGRIEGRRQAEAERTRADGLSNSQQLEIIRDEVAKVSTSVAVLRQWAAGAEEWLGKVERAQQETAKSVHELTGEVRRYRRDSDRVPPVDPKR